MPFPQQTPIPFTQASILNLAEGQYGCYGLFNLEDCLFIGRGDIREKLLDHVKGLSSNLSNSRPTHFVAMVTSDAHEAESQLIAEFKPPYNLRLQSDVPTD